MKFLDGANPFRDLPPEAGCFTELLQKAMSRQADVLFAEAASMGVIEEDAAAIIVWAMLKNSIQHIAYETIRNGETFPRAEFAAMAEQIIGFIEE